MADTSWMARFGARLVTNGYAIWTCRVFVPPPVLV